MAIKTMEGYLLMWTLKTLLRHSLLLSLFGFTFVSIAWTSLVHAALPNNYDITIPPSTSKEPVPIFLDVFIVDVFKINSSTQSLTGDVYMIVRWTDLRLANGNRSNVYELDKVWHPQVTIINQQEVSKSFPDTAEVSPSGQVKYRQRFTGTFSMPMDLHAFPIDRHHFDLQLVCPGTSAREITLISNGQSGIAKKLSLQGWNVANAEAESKPYLSPGGKELPGFILSVKVSRQKAYYFFESILPLIFVLAMSWTAFWISPKEFGTRQGICVTTVLTIIAFRLTFASKLPEISYLTRFDIILLMSTAMAFLAIVEVVAVDRLIREGNEDQAHRVDLWTRMIYPAIIFGTIAWAFLLPSDQV